MNKALVIYLNSTRIVSSIILAKFILEDRFTYSYFKETNNKDNLIRWFKTQQYYE